MIINGQIDQFCSLSYSIRIILSLMSFVFLPINSLTAEYAGEQQKTVTLLPPALKLTSHTRRRIQEHITTKNNQTLSHYQNTRISYASTIFQHELFSLYRLCWTFSQYNWRPAVSPKMPAATTMEGNKLSSELLQKHLSVCTYPRMTKA